MPRFDVHMESSAEVVRGHVIVEAATLEEAIAQATRAESVDWVVAGGLAPARAVKIYNYDTGRTVYVKGRHGS
jgi:hypothetical protein